MQFFEKNEKNEKNEMNEFMLKDAMKNCKLESSRKDAIWEQIRAKRSEYSTRGSRRHLEKIIVGYICAALVFTLSVTVGASLWPNVTEGKEPNPAGARPTENSAGMQLPTSGDPNTDAPIIGGTKSIWGDKEGVEDFVKLLNTEKGWENEPMNKLEDDRDELNYQFNTSYSAENILRIHSSDLEGQDDYQIYQQYGDELKSWVLYRGETIYPLTEWQGKRSPSIGSDCTLYTTRVPISIYDITLANPLEDEPPVLLIVANSRQFWYHVDWHDDDTKDYYFERVDADAVHVYEFNLDKGLNSIGYTDEEDELFYVFRNRTGREHIVNIWYAHPNTEVALVVTGEFSYESSIEKEYGCVVFDCPSEDLYPGKWFFVHYATEPPGTTSPNVTNPPFTTDLPKTQPEVSTELAPIPGEPPIEPPITTEPDIPPVEDFENEQGLLLRKSPWRDSYLVVGIGSCKDTDLVIPGSYNGLPLSIGSYAFEDCEGLVSVTLSEGIYEIGSGAFQKIDSLTSITIPSTVGTVGDNAFWGCTKLESVTIAEGVLRYGAEVFFGCRSLKTITIPKGAEYIGEWIFDDCDSLTDVYYGGSKEEWEYAAFDVMPPDHATLHFGE